MAGAKAGFFRGDVKELMNDIQELKPTVFASVPRLLNRVYDKVCGGRYGGEGGMWGEEVCWGRYGGEEVCGGMYGGGEEVPTGLPLTPPPDVLCSDGIYSGCIPCQEVAI